MSKQAVSTTPEAEPSQVSAENEPTAQDDLDALLNEYTEPASEPEVTAQSAQPAATPDEMAEFRQYMSETRADKLNTGLQDSAKLVKAAAGESAANIPDWMMVGALREESTKNPNLEKIFNERGSNPEAWNKVATALGKKISQDLSPTDKSSTESWAAVDSAVHSASTSTNQTEAPKDLSKMTDQEFEAHKRSLR